MSKTVFWPPAEGEQAFDVVVPSLPGFGFSSAPTQPGFGVGQMAATLNALMLMLGHNKYCAQGMRTNAMGITSTLFPAAEWSLAVRVAGVIELCRAITCPTWSLRAAAPRNQI